METLTGYFQIRVVESESVNRDAMKSERDRSPAWIVQPKTGTGRSQCLTTMFDL